MLRFVTFLLGFVIALSNASLFCPHTKMPSDLKSFETLRIQLKKAVGQEPMYRIANIQDTDKSYTVSSQKFRLMTRTDNVECPSKSCITEISAAQPKSLSSTLYLTNIIGKMIPPGFHHVESSTRLYCVIMPGDCGATVPIYRYYKFLPSGLYHAYSTNEDIEIEGYVREPQPLCYGWQTLSNEQLRAEGIEGSGEDEDLSSEEIEVTSDEREEGKREEFKMLPEVCDDKTPPKPSSMKALNVYVNDKTGALKDHYYTTKVATPENQKDSENEFYGYQLDEKASHIGMVVVDEEKSKCGCLIRLSQMLDEQTGMFTRKDHKLAADFKEPPPSGGEKYVALDEEVFCVREKGACGANVELRKYFNILELDTIYTVNKTDIPPLTVPSPPGVLCYIWPYQKPHKKDPKKEEIAVKKQKTTEKTKTTSAPKTTVTSKPTTTTLKPKPTTTVQKPTTIKSSTTLEPKTTVSITTENVKATEVTTTTPTKSIVTSSPSSTVSVQTSTEKSSTVSETTSPSPSSTTPTTKSLSSTTTNETTVETTKFDSKKKEETPTTAANPKTETEKATKSS